MESAPSAAQGVSSEMSGQRITHWIAGKAWSDPPERTGEVYDPATGTVSGRVDFAGQETVNVAVNTAKNAYTLWSNISLSRRTRVLFEFRRLLKERGDEVAS